MVQDRTGEPVVLLFDWRDGHGTAFKWVLPIMTAIVAFAFLLGFVRVRVATPQFKMASKASCIQLPATGVGVAWAMRAREGGPWLSRYEPDAWSGYAAMQDELLQATRIPPQPYAPALRPLPPEAPPGLQPLAAKGEPVLPQRMPAVVVPPNLAGWRLAPVLLPLSTVGSAGLPQTLPPFSGEIDAAMAGTEWRFLLRLNPAGEVAECVALNKAAGAGLLENWLRGIRFDPKLAADGWLAVGIGFINQPVHGTDTR